MGSEIALVPAMTGSPEAYVGWISQIPILSEVEEAELFRRLREEHDLEAAKQLVLHHLRFVVHIARGYLGYGLPQADLIQEGTIGLMKAVKKFDLNYGVRLVTFAVYWIKAEIHEYILRKSDEEIAQLFAPIVANNGVDESMERITQVVHMMKDRVNFVKELWPLCSFFFLPPTSYDEKTVKKRWKEYSAQQMTELMGVLEGIDDFSIEGQEPVVMQWVADKGYKLGDVMNAFRLTLVGEGKGPGMFDISAFLGKEETLARMRKAISVLG